LYDRLSAAALFKYYFICMKVLERERFRNGNAHPHNSFNDLLLHNMLRWKLSLKIDINDVTFSRSTDIMTSL
jgi:hypothetical protein